MKDLPSETMQTQPRAIGSVAAGFDLRDHRPRLTRLRQAGSLRALFPQNAAKSLQMVLTNTSGGVTGGDRFQTELTLDGTGLRHCNDPGRRACLSRATGPDRARQHQATGGARQPRELAAAGNHPLRRLRPATPVDRRGRGRRVRADRRAVGLRPHSDARTALLRGLRRPDRDQAGQQILFLDRVVLDGDIDTLLHRPAVANGAGAMALVALLSRRAEAQLEKARDMLPETGGASLLAPDLLVIRLLAADSFDLRKSLIPIINLLHDDALPRPWMI